MPPAISGGRVYVGSKDKKLYVLDLKTGRELWSFTAGRGIAASPAIGDGVLVIAGMRRWTICFVSGIDSELKQSDLHDPSLPRHISIQIIREMPHQPLKFIGTCSSGGVRRDVAIRAA